MHVVDAVSELFDKDSRIEELRSKMAWVKVNTKARMVPDASSVLRVVTKS